MNYIPWVISGIATLFAILTFARNGQRDNMKDRAEQMAKMENLAEAMIKANLKLDTVCATTNETRSDIKALNNSIIAIDKRLSVVENDLKTAFMRIDELRESIKEVKE
jgi:uncharacterized coiled-coil DUF342 family protein